MESELTKVTKEDLAESHKSDDYVYSADWKRLISFPPIPEEGRFYKGTFHISSSTKVICDNACDIDHCGWLSTDVDIDIRIPEGVTHLGDYVFKGRKLDIVEIPRSLNYIGKNPFALTSLWKIINHNQRFVLRNNSFVDLELGKLIHNISDNGLIVIEKDIISIGEYSFSRNEEPNIYYYRAEDEEDLVITVPSTVREIGDNAFENSKVSTIIFLGLPQKIGKDIFKGCTLLKDIHVPIGLVETYKEVLHDNANLIDCTGNVVNGIVYRNLLASNGITNFYKVSYDWNISIYAYIKDKKLHFSDEKGNELKREDIGIKKGIIVLDLKDNIYNFLPENKTPNGKAVAVDDSNNITWLEHDEDFYFYVTDNQILIHKSKYIRDINERIKADKDYEDGARFFGNHSNSEITAYNSKLFVYHDDSDVRVIYFGKQYPNAFNEIEVWGGGNKYDERSTILVCINNEWGMITLDNNYIEPQYKSIKRFYNTSFLYELESHNGKMGVMNGFGDVVIDPDYEFLEIGDMTDWKSIYVVITDKNLYTIFPNRDKKKDNYISYSEIPNIENSKVKKWGTKKFIQYTEHDEVWKCTFLKIVKEDNSEYIFDQNCNDITDSDEFYQWEEEESWMDWDWY